MSAHTSRIQRVSSEDVVDFPDDDDGARLGRIESGLISLGLEQVGVVSTPLEDLRRFTRGALTVALYWDGFLTSLRLETGEQADFVALFADMAGSPAFTADA